MGENGLGNISQPLKSYTRLLAICFFKILDKVVGPYLNSLLNQDLDSFFSLQFYVSVGN